MRRKYIGLLFIAFVLSIFAGIVGAQEPKPEETPTDVAASTPKPESRANMLRQLGLSREQFQQIKRINAERKPLIDGATTRMRLANRALDEAIYSDQVSESDVQAKIREFQGAQAEVVKIRFMNELSIRQILTADQLVRFRDLRTRFERTRKEHEMETRRTGGRQPAATDVKATQIDQRTTRPFVRQKPKSP